MPFKSAEQERAMFAKSPEVAERWAHKYGNAPGYNKSMKRVAQKRKQSRSKRRGR